MRGEVFILFETREHAESDGDRHGEGEDVRRRLRPDKPVHAEERLRGVEHGDEEDALPRQGEKRRPPRHADGLQHHVA